MKMPLAFMIVLFLLVALLILPSCTDRREGTSAPDLQALGDAPYVIRGDGGGQLISAQADRFALESWGGPVEIRGKCRSACTIFITLPNACIGKGSTIGFHGSNVNVGPIGWRQMHRYYRGDMADIYKAEWRHIPSNEIHDITAQEAKRLDPLINICGAK